MLTDDVGVSVFREKLEPLHVQNVDQNNVDMFGRNTGR